MTKYIRVSDLQYPFTERDIKALFPNTSFPAKFRATDFEIVFPVPAPACTSLERAVEGQPQISTKGNWEQTWIIVDKFQEYTDSEGSLHTKEDQEAAFIAQEQANQTAALKKACEQAITQRIQDTVDTYNIENDLTFDNVHHCESYARVDGYSHQAFCQAVWAWNVATWEAARTVLAQALAGEITITSPSDVIALLPEFTI